MSLIRSSYAFLWSDPVTIGMYLPIGMVILWIPLEKQLEVVTRLLMVNRYPSINNV